MKGSLQYAMNEEHGENYWLSRKYTEVDSRIGFLKVNISILDSISV